MQKDAQPGTYFERLYQVEIYDLSILFAFSSLQVGEEKRFKEFGFFFLLPLITILLF